MVEEKHEELRAFRIERTYSPELDTNLDMWVFEYETYIFMLIMNPSKFVIDEEYGRGRLVSALGMKPDDEEFVELDERMWFRQIDALREMMPRLRLIDERRAKVE